MSNIFSLFGKKENSEEINKIISHYNLQEWWVSTFSEDERKYIAENSFLKGTDNNWDNAEFFLSSISISFTSPKNQAIYNRIKQKIDTLKKAGYVNGKHYTTYVEDVKKLVRDEKLSEAEILLLELISGVEVESQTNNYGVAPWYYWELAVVYRKQKKFVIIR